MAAEKENVEAGRVQGLIKIEIADQTKFSYYLVDTPLRNIYTKLHVRGRTSSLAKAVTDGCFDPGGNISALIPCTMRSAFLPALRLAAAVAAAVGVASAGELPPPVPYLNAPEDYFLGNGVAAGGGATDGTWNFLAGPDYTCPNYLEHEEIHLSVDSVQQSLTVAMHRARKTGIFYGAETNGDLKICLVDYGVDNESWLGRLVTVENQSHSTAHEVGVTAVIRPLLGSGRNSSLVVDRNGRPRGVSLTLGTSLKCAKSFCPNWAERRAVIAFNNPAATAEESTNHDYVLRTGARSVAPGGSADFTLYHCFDYVSQNEGGGFESLPSRNSRADVQACVAGWQSWFDSGAPRYALSRIPNERARNLVEGGLAILKMNECRDGGIVANERGWDMSYVRDAYCGLRGLEAFGHFAEAKRFIQWLDHKYTVHGLIPNAAPGGSDTYAHPNGNNGRTCPEANASVEVTALYLLAARDYYRNTHDLKTLTNADTSLRYAMDIQLKQALNNGCRLEFSGDETELCGASDVPALKQEGFNRDLALYWSMTSVALCSASLDFYIQYLRLLGRDPAHYLNHQDNRRLNLNDELGKLQDALERDFWRTDVPECPGGFHDWFRVKSNQAWPSGRLVNFTLFPIYYGTPLEYPDRARRDVEAMKQYYQDSARSLPVVGLPGHKSMGHDLGYLLWGLVAVGDSKQAAVVYDALVNGPTACCWGAYHEAYQADGTPNANGLRSFETGVNLSAIARFWHIGDVSEP